MPKEGSVMESSGRPFMYPEIQMQRGEGWQLMILVDAVPRYGSTDTKFPISLHTVPVGAQAR